MKGGIGFQLGSASTGWKRWTYATLLEAATLLATKIEHFCFSPPSRWEGEFRRTDSLPRPLPKS